MQGGENKNLTAKAPRREGFFRKRKGDPGEFEGLPFFLITFLRVFAPLRFKFLS
jgi:hypothetical protein